MAVDLEEQKPPLLLRRLGRHERYCLARHNLGHPPILCGIASGEVQGGWTEVEQIHQRLRDRIAKVQGALAQLHCHVADPRALSPRWARRLQQSITADQILLPIERFPLTTAEDKASHKAGPSSCGLDDRAELLSSMQRWGRTTFAEVRRPPFWRVRLVVEETEQSDNDGSNGRLRFAIILVAHHLALDGQGFLTLFRLLCQAEELPLPSDQELRGQAVKAWDTDHHLTTEEANECLPPTSDTTLQTYAPYPWVLWRLLVNKLASWKAYWWPAPSVWPQTLTLDRKVAEHFPHWRLVEVVDAKDRPAPTVPLLVRLKENARQHGILTLNPVLHTACAFALYVHLVRNGHGNVQRTSNDDQVPIVMHSARGERMAQRYGMVVGNYVSLFGITPSIGHHTHFWQMARTFVAEFDSPQGVAQRKRCWSMLPDRLGTWSDRWFTVTDRYPTPWERAFGLPMLRSIPATSSLGFSNLGLTKISDPRLDAMLWSQYPPLGEAIMVDGMGWQTTQERQGLSLMLGLREGILGVKGGPEEESFAEALRMVLHLLASEDHSEAKANDGTDDTFDNLWQRMDKQRTSLS